MNFIFNIRVRYKYYLLFLFLLFIFSCTKKINGEVQGNINTNDNVSDSFRFPVIVVKARKGTLSNYIT
ncbi:hypothetical protein O5404_03580 [Borrelia miyamotoi]|uniref:Uncharacterized protein n=1 Tax=Borrelia miyamotoi TaxID=47466 RepID=A0AAX3JN36_9SPIR|nr:hypothetical protein [Borrelia miyamotoi]WAZ72079.1 hypothetical protein O5404_03580 [Borrelia miyamotoi]WVI04709.1 hypothetical protein F9Y91_06835 [Borrelia miyamotoi]